ncbi:TetR family transcriptional regulator [uncultured Mycobacterium sp.]|uniref:TetR family transcriptional regulator n=1 Tax=uncultured Mycobacterium sp. TaxID=171292 RepID=A0A1Y5PK93_9MYCO|nr:TetR family transcriptional regulator [uncultured Mycobacterium sp.]
MAQLTNAGAGRPRDPQVDERVQQAACQLYGRVGWSGFSIDAVAREAKVGKSSIYLRWSDQTTLLLETLESRIDVPYDTDTGSLRGDLVVLARSILAILLGESGSVLLRLSAEARAVPELAPRWEAFMAANVVAMRAIARRGTARGDLPTNAPVTVMLDALFGGLLMHVLATPPSRIKNLVSQGDRYSESLVDLVLAAVDRT